MSDEKVQVSTADTDPVAAVGGEQSHDPEYPERLREFMRTGWRDSEVAVTPRPEDRKSVV